MTQSEIERLPQHIEQFLIDEGVFSDIQDLERRYYGDLWVEMPMREFVPLINKLLALTHTEGVQQ